MSCSLSKAIGIDFRPTHHVREESRETKVGKVLHADSEGHDFRPQSVGKNFPVKTKGYRRPPDTVSDSEEANGSDGNPSSGLVVTSKSAKIDGNP